MRVIVRGFKRAGNRRALIFQDHYEIDPAAPPPFEKIVEQHAAMLRDGPHMIEFEFPDVPETEGRYFRMGTDPSMMVLPIQVKL